jgi:hypothetical protein
MATAGEDSAADGQPPPGLLSSFSDFLSALSVQYRAARGSIFMDGLVGGMFLAFLMDTDESCFDDGFHDLFFAIGILHFLSSILGSLADYGRRAAAMDGEETRLERKTALVCVVLQHLIKLAQYPALAALGYYVVKFNMTAHWTMTSLDDVEPKGAGKTNCTKCYCDRNNVNLATLVFCFQLFYGFVWMAAFFVMWWVDREDDDAEMEEEQLYIEEERAARYTLFGKVKFVVKILGMHSFFNGKVASAMLSISLALPEASCRFKVTEWFLIIGIVYTLTGVMQKLLVEVEEMAKKDGIVNRAEHYMIDAIKFVMLPLFIIELVAFGRVVELTVTNYKNIELKDKEDDYYCVEGVWHLMQAMSGIYTVLLLFRVWVIVASMVKRALETAETGAAEA